MLRPAQRTQFYPGDLRAQLEEFLLDWHAPEGLPSPPSGGIVPHAGWAYSGRIAARTLFTLIQLGNPRTIVFLGAVHFAPMARPAFYAEGAWETPVGSVEVDTKLARRLLESLGELATEAPEEHDGEHSLEVLMPFVRLLAQQCRVVPVAVPPYPGAAAFGARLGALLAGHPDVLVVASTDLTHYGAGYGFAPAEAGEEAERWMQKNDERIVDKIRHLSAEEILPEVRKHKNACGPGALAAALAAARARGSTRGHVLAYTTSHRVMAEPEFTTAVGYLGAVLY